MMRRVLRRGFVVGHTFVARRLVYDGFARRSIRGTGRRSHVVRPAPPAAG